MNKLALLAVLACVTALGCSSSPAVVQRSEPINYDEAMERLAAQLAILDKQVGGGLYEPATAAGERVLELSTMLGQFEPPRIGRSYDALVHYNEQADDMRRAADRMLFLVQQRRREAMLEQLQAVAYRFNYISANFGPNLQVGVLGNPPAKLLAPADYRADLPSDLSTR